MLVHVPGKGYVGHGAVVTHAQPITDAVVKLDGQSTPLLDLPLVSPGLGSDVDDDVKREYVVFVYWRTTVSERDAYWRPGLYFRRTTVWPFENESDADEIRTHL